MIDVTYRATPGTITRPSRVTIGLALLALASVLTAATLQTADRPTVAVVWGGLALGTYIAGLACLLPVTGSGLGEAFARWKLGPAMLAWWSLAFGVASVTWSQPQTGTQAEIALPYVLRALALMAFALASWYAGYLIGPGNVVRHAAHRILQSQRGKYGTDIRSPYTPWILYLIGTAARLISAAATGRFGFVGSVSTAVSSATSFGHILSMIAYCAPMGVAAAALRTFSENRPGSRKTLAILFVAELIAGGLSGNKLDFVITVLAIIIPFSAARRRWPKLAILLVAVSFLAVIIPFNHAYRAIARTNSVTLSPTEAPSRAPAILAEVFSVENLVTAVPRSADFLLQRTREIGNVAIIMQRTPGEIPFSSPIQIVEAPLVAIVPRAIWPGKPILDSGYQFSQQYYELPSSLYTSSAVTPVGDLYRHGGWIVVIAGMCALGLGIRLLDDVLDIRDNPRTIFLILPLFPTIVAGESDWGTMIASVPGIIVMWIIVVSMSFAKLPQ